MLITVEKSPSDQVDVLAAASSSIAAVVEEVSALVADQSEPCRGDPFVGSVLDPLLLPLQELLHHSSNGQNVDHLPSVCPGSQFDVPLLCQTQCLVFP